MENNNQELNNKTNTEIKPQVNHNSRRNLLILLVIILILIGLVAYKLLTDKWQEENGVKDLSIKRDTNDYVTYKCKNVDCAVFPVMSSPSNATGNEFDALVYDNGKYWIFNYKDKSRKEVSIPKNDYQYVNITYDKDNKPASVFLDKSSDDETQIAIFSVKKNKMIIDFDSFNITSPLIGDNIDRYHILRYDELEDGFPVRSKYKVYSDKDEKIVLEKEGISHCDPSLFISENKLYYIDLYQNITGGDFSVREVQSIDGKVLYKNNVKYDKDDYEDAYNMIRRNYVIFDEKKHQIVIVDNQTNQFLIYDKDYNLVKTSKKYTSIAPYNNGEAYREYFSQTDNFYLVVNDNGKLNVIDYNENVIATIANVDAKLKIESIESNYDENKQNRLIKIYIPDKTLKIEDYTDADIKRLRDNATRAEVLDEYKSGIIGFAYEYTYNIESKKIEKNKCFYYYD